jgi:hypothetical protein
MIQPFPFGVITMFDVQVGVNEYYVQFVPPATFGVILDRANRKVYLVLANGERTPLRRTADKIYTLRGFIGLRRREDRTLTLGWSMEDNLIRLILYSFGTADKLEAAVWKYCPSVETAEAINELWGPEILVPMETG